jgi:predicted DNA-binding transcriptional regulator YafY
MKNRDKLSLPQLKIRIEPEMAFRIYDDFTENEIEKQTDGSFLITVPFINEGWLYGFLLSYGAHIEVLEPESVRNIMKEEAENIFKKYL